MREAGRAGRQLGAIYELAVVFASTARVTHLLVGAVHRLTQEQLVSEVHHLINIYFQQMEKRVS